MSAEQRPPTTRYYRPHPSPEGPTREGTAETDPDDTDAADDEYEFRFRSSASPTATSRSTDDPHLPTCIERVELRSRVIALERALETSERRRQAIITQYERLLEERTGADDSSADAGRARTLAARLLERWRR